MQISGILHTVLLVIILTGAQAAFADISLQLKSGQKIICQEVSTHCPFYKCEDDSFLFGPKAIQNGLAPNYQKITSDKLILETPDLIVDQNNKILFQNKSQFQYANKTGSGFLNYFRNSGIHLAQSFALNKCPEAFKADYRKKINDYTNVDQVEAAKKMEVQLGFSSVDMYPSYTSAINQQSSEQKIKDAMSTLSELP